MVFMVIVSFFTKKPTAKQVEFISFSGDYKKLVRQSWDKWDVIASLGVVVCCALFYWYFW
jgi:solute:Na+ symporter, SSS family